MADISKAKKLLNYNPRTNVEIGIPKFVNWYEKLHSMTSFTVQLIVFAIVFLIFVLSKQILQ